MNRSTGNGRSSKRRMNERVPVTVRLPQRLVKQIDEQVNHRDVPISRNNWLLEAAIEKLKKDTGGSHGPQ
jgi:hypothetical protein